MKIFTPIYNEMPWTPFFLRHLLDYDCPIVIAEGAADTIQNGSPRSTDGSLEIIKEFVRQWRDRVSLYYHNRKLIKKRNEPFRDRRPKWHIKYFKCWETLSDGELMVALAPDNFFTLEGIKRLKEIERENEFKDYYHILPYMKVFTYNFHTIVENPTEGICGPWFNLWPCIYRKNPEWIITIGSELLMQLGTRRPLIAPSIQRHLDRGFKHAIILPDIINFHYKGVKKLESRIKRFGTDTANKWLHYPLDIPELKIYNGNHPTILDKHPWRHTVDCRLESDNFDWREFLYLVQRR
jgi:hypothetical protein